MELRRTLAARQFRWMPRRQMLPHGEAPMDHPARALIARAAAVILLLGELPAAAAALDDPATPVREAYRLEKESLAQRRTPELKPPWQAPHREKLFSKRFAGLWATDERYSAATHDMGNIEHDPFIAAQDHEADVLRDLVIDVVERNGNRAEVRARFTNLGLVDVRFTVILEDGRWVIDDIHNRMEGAAYSIAEMLARPYWCTENWKERCRSSTP